MHGRANLSVGMVRACHCKAKAEASRPVDSAKEGLLGPQKDLGGLPLVGCHLGLDSGCKNNKNGPCIGFMKMGRNGLELVFKTGLFGLR